MPERKGFMRLFKPKTLNFISGKLKIFEAGKSIKVIDGIRFNSITIESIGANTGLIMIGSIGVNIDNSFTISPGNAISIDAGRNFIEDIYVNSNVSGSMVQYFGIGEKI